MSTSWIIPCNPKVYDVVKHFEEQDTIYWKKGAGQKIGDYVYIYVGLPKKEILFRCIVEDNHVDSEEMKKHPYATAGNFGNGYQYMMLRKEIQLDTPVPLEKIQELGTYMIRKQCRVDRKLLLYLEEIVSKQKNEV